MSKILIIGTSHSDGSCKKEDGQKLIGNKVKEIIEKRGWE